MLIIAVILAACLSFKTSFASAGDKSRFFQNCVYDCKVNVCDLGLYKPSLNSLLGIGWSPWSCLEDCDYGCQWETVDKFLERKWNVPQFRGKWPFVRMFGLQEPASAIFSLFNFFVVLNELTKYRKVVPKGSPHYYLWHIYSAVCLNAWAWSSIYHTRDTDFTERMDYISASLMVFFSFYAMTVVAFSLGKSVMSVIWTIACACVILNHMAYLWFFKFDYTYNMTFNIIIGCVTIIGWIVFAFIKPDQPHRKVAALYSVLIAGSTVLEVFDFPPFLWTFDAHSLWHLSTIFITGIFYDFLRKEYLYISKLSSQKLPTQLKVD